LFSGLDAITTGHVVIGAVFLVLLDDDVTDIALTLTSHPFLWMGVVMVSSSQRYKRL
jgi:hypothetical protein